MSSSPHEPSFADQTDVENAYRGRLGGLDPCVVTNASGREVWNNDRYSFLHGECPPTANPKLWRHSQLTAIQGIFEVVPGVYQIRGLDISNMTVIEGDRGIIVVDPLTSTECAQAALQLYHSHRGKRPTTGVLYSHSHSDHFGGAAGVLPSDWSGIPIVAPEGFVEEAVSENVFCGPAMRRRAGYMYGIRLPKQPDGQVGTGLGMCVATGTSRILPPNTIVRETGEELVIDGVKLLFQMVPNTEAPAEFNFYLPQHKALYISECATHSLHNIITLRGALVRDAKSWAKHLDESIALYGDRSEALFSGHQWPTWGQSEIVKFISEQRDLYAFLHDQTVRMMNLGFTGTEIAERMVLPPQLSSAWHTQGFYGSVSHNVKGIYQRYLTWFDGNPVNLWPHPPAEEAKRYLTCFGGLPNLLQKADEFAQGGDLRFAATLLGHAVAAVPDSKPAREKLAIVLEQLGFGAENATWRNFYLTGAMDLRAGGRFPPRQTTPLRLELMPFGTIDQWLDTLSIMLDGLEAAKEPATTFLLREGKTAVVRRVLLCNGALSHRRLTAREVQSIDFDAQTPRTLTLTATKEELFGILQGNIDLARSQSSGDFQLLLTLFKLCSVPVGDGTHTRL